MEQPEEVHKLVELPLLAGMPAEAKERVANVFLEVSDRVDLEDGEELMHEGYLAFECGYVLFDGLVQIEKEGQVLSEVSAPTLLGEMSQFKSCDTRTATVRAIGETAALEFYWDDLYAQVKEGLSEEEQALFMAAIERLVWDRFGQESLMDLALFKGLTEEVRLQTCIIFPWICERREFTGGDTLFEAGDRCKSTGHLLTRGNIRLVWPEGENRIINAPNILGVMPNHDPALQWTATAVADDDGEVLLFSWKRYIETIKERLSHNDENEVARSMRANANAHFWH